MKNVNPGECMFGVCVNIKCFCAIFLFESVTSEADTSLGKRVKVKEFSNSVCIACVVCQVSNSSSRQSVSFSSFTFLHITRLVIFLRAVKLVRYSFQN